MKVWVSNKDVFCRKSSKNYVAVVLPDCVTSHKYYF